MSPIRVGLIGLSTNGNAPTGSWGVHAHLPSIQKSPHYELVALANSSVESASASITHHKLGPHVKAYGTAEDLAKDPNVDLVVISVNVGKHYALAKPVLLSKKDVFVEWPLGANTAEAAELTELARENHVKSIVGLQARADPLVLKVKELVESGRIGEVTSTTVVGKVSGIAFDKWPKSAEYFLDVESGGNVLTIYFGHFLDTFTHVLGGFTELNSVVKTQYPTVQLLDEAGNVVEPNHQKSAHDHILVQGTLSNGAAASLSYRSVKFGIDSVGIRWLISGTNGEIEITTPEIPWQMGAPGTTLRVRSGEDSQVEEVDFAITGSTTQVNFPATNTALTYDAFAKGEVSKFATFEDALTTHRLLDRVRF